MIKLGLAMVVAVLGTTSSLRFFEFWNCLVVLCYEVFCFVSLEEGLSPLLKLHA